MASSYDQSITSLFLNGDDLDQNSDGEDGEYLESELKKLEELKNICFEKSLDRNLIEKCLQNLHVENFLTNEVLEPKHHQEKNCINSISKYEKRYIKYLLLEKEELNKNASTMLKVNRQLEKEIIEQKLQLKDCIKRRKKLMNEATILHGFISGKLTTSQYLNLSDLHTTIDDMETLQKNDPRQLAKRMTDKSVDIAIISRILHNLICFSNKLWATDKNLLEIVFCTGEILGRYFSAENREESKKVIDDVLYRLSHVKI